MVLHTINIQQQEDDHKYPEIPTANKQMKQLIKMNQQVRMI